jgi:hypothetical protein
MQRRRGKPALRAARPARLRVDWQVWRYIVLVTDAVVPRALWGSAHNRAVVLERACASAGSCRPCMVLTGDAQT